MKYFIGIIALLVVAIVVLLWDPFYWLHTRPEKPITVTVQVLDDKHLDCNIPVFDAEVSDPYEHHTYGRTNRNGYITFTAMRTQGVIIKHPDYKSQEFAAGDLVDTTVRLVKPKGKIRLKSDFPIRYEFLGYDGDSVTGQVEKTQLITREIELNQKYTASLFVGTPEQRAKEATAEIFLNAEDDVCDVFVTTTQQQVDSTTETVANVRWEAFNLVVMVNRKVVATQKFRSDENNLPAVDRDLDTR